MNKDNYAVFGKRAAAFLIDTAIISIPLAVIYSFLNIAYSGRVDVLNYLQGKLELLKWRQTFVWIGLGCIWLYSTLFECSLYQATPGKRALGIIVTDTSGKRLSIIRSAGRALIKYILSGFFGIGYLFALFTEKRQALHDLVSGCLVLEKSSSSSSPDIMNSPSSTYSDISGLDVVYKATVVFLLASILGVLIKVYTIIPRPTPTYGEVQLASEGDERQALINQSPYVEIGGKVSIINDSSDPLLVKGTVDINDSVKIRGPVNVAGYVSVAGPVSVYANDPLVVQTPPFRPLEVTTSEYKPLPVSIRNPVKVQANPDYPLAVDILHSKPLDVNVRNTVEVFSPFGVPRR